MYASASQRGYCAKLNLCNDIERNPGSPIHSIDHTLTIKAPYCQSDIMAFNENAGKQCVASRGGGLLPYKRLMGICHWMGLHFHDWIDYNWVTFLVELLEWGCTFLGFLG